MNISRAMSIHRKVAQLSLAGIFLVVLALLRQHSSASIQGSKGRQELQWLNGSLPTSPPGGSTWTHLGHLRTPYSSSVSQKHARPFQKQESEYTRTLVVPQMKTDDTSWIAKELPDLSATVYIANDPSASLHPPKNKGHEVMVYLTYIIDHYNKLPDIIIFMHAHRWTHHNNELLDNDAIQIIRRLSNAYVSRQGYVNLRCQWVPGCPEWLHPDSGKENLGKQEEAVLSDAWNELFPSHPLPMTLSQPCCAQFALSRQRVHSIPLSQFAFFRDWILRTPLSDYISGRIWEYSWQYLFTNQSVSCPAEHLCYCDAFGVCFGGAEEYSNYEDARLTKLDYEAQIEELRQQQVLSRMPGERSNNANTSSVESNKYSYLYGQVRALDRELAARRKNAIERGSDPRMRAEECGRQWKDGDGF